MSEEAEDAHQSNGYFAGRYGIQGFPSIKLISGPSSEELKVVDYKSDRSAQSIVEWAFREAKKVALRRLGAKTGTATPSARNLKLQQVLICASTSWSRRKHAKSKP